MLRAKRAGRRGNAMMEFAIVAPCLLLVFTGVFTVASTLNRALQARQVVRDANVLMVRGVDLSIAENQAAILKAADGLGLGNRVGQTYVPDPAGKGVLILSKVIRVGPVYCNSGIPGWNQDAATCPNHGEYVTGTRIAIGNSGQWQSVMGNPGGAPDPRGNFSDADIATNTATRAQGFPAIIQMNLDEWVYVAEIYVDAKDLTLAERLVSIPHIYARNLS